MTLQRHNIIPSYIYTRISSNHHKMADGRTPRTNGETVPWTMITGYPCTRSGLDSQQERSCGRMPEETATVMQVARASVGADREGRGGPQPIQLSPAEHRQRQFPVDTGDARRRAGPESLPQPGQCRRGAGNHTAPRSGGPPSPHPFRFRRVLAALQAIRHFIALAPAILLPAHHPKAPIHRRILRSPPSGARPCRRATKDQGQCCLFLRSVRRGLAF